MLTACYYSTVGIAVIVATYYRVSNRIHRETFLGAANRPVRAPLSAILLRPAILVPLSALLISNAFVPFLLFFVIERTTSAFHSTSPGSEALLALGFLVGWANPKPSVGRGGDTPEQEKEGPANIALRLSGIAWANEFLRRLFQVHAIWSWNKISQVADEALAEFNLRENKLAREVLAEFGSDSINLVFSAFMSNSTRRRTRRPPDPHRAVLLLLRQSRTSSIRRFRALARAALPPEQAPRDNTRLLESILRGCSLSCLCCTSWVRTNETAGECTHGHGRAGKADTRPPWTHFWCEDHECEKDPRVSHPDVIAVLDRRTSALAARAPEHTEP